ncbi:MAG TPA: hypothetical protein VIB39_10325 [Candidatus Angelobacter sp.]|jgi:hypothetical protein
MATAAVLTSRDTGQEPTRSAMRDQLPVLAGGFVAGLLLHGVLDFLPHSYPIKPSLDVASSLCLFGAAIIFSKRRHLLLITACFLGAIFPDLIDLGPAILKSRLGWSLPVVKKTFPWHWPQYSGSIYDGSKALQSFSLHVVVIGLSLGVLYQYRRALFRFWERQSGSR